MCQSLQCCGPRYGTRPALQEQRKVQAGVNMLCIKCRNVNTCADSNHKHVRLGQTMRVPRKTASEYRWNQFFKRFPRTLKTE